MKLFVLEQTNLGLSHSEVLMLAKPKKFLLEGNLLFIDSRWKSYNRLAYTKEVHSLLFSCDIEKLEHHIKRYRWNKRYKENFRVTSYDKSISEKTVGSIIWNNVNRPKVNLTDPKTEFTFFAVKNKAYACIKVYTNIEDFESRKSHKRNDPVPISLHPKLARCMVNLTGINKGTIYDPCVGTGGFLIEAGLIGIRAVGSDIDPIMIERSKKNFESMKIKKYSLMTADATKVKKRYDYIVTDLPYAKNTKSLDIDNFYLAFMQNLKKICRKTAVIAFPDFCDYKKYIKGFKTKSVHKYYLHRSLSKVIVVLQRRSE